MYNIDKNAHYFILMHPLHDVFGLISYTCSNDPEKWVECEVIEDRYKVEDGYKITLRALEDGYGSKTFYQCDFNSLIKNRHIIKKVSDKQHVELCRCYEPFMNNLFLVHEGWEVVE